MNWVTDTKNKIIAKYQATAIKNRGTIPYTTDENGNYQPVENDICWWTNGFWGGLMWLMYQETHDELFKEIAQETEEMLDKSFEEYYGLHHDVGFMFMPTAVADYRLTGNEKSRKRALLAANLLAGRFNIAGYFLRAWNDLPGEDTRGWAIIDCMLNLSLLYWASRETNDPRYEHIAVAHADNVMEHFIRENGSSIHIGEFNPQKGGFVKSHTGQGYNEESAWSRGQGWAVYGFMLSYEKTGKKEYLETAVRVADFILENIREDFEVPIDFCQPKEEKWLDNCGACIIAGGMLKLSDALGVEGQKYFDCGAGIIKNITEKYADFGNECDAIVQNCNSAYHVENYNMTMNYADYYYLEAILKLEGKDYKMW